MNKQWFHAGFHAARGAQVSTRDHPQPDRSLQAFRNSQANKEAQELKKAETDLFEAQRRIERQIVLIGELSERGEAILEPERALIRLQTKMLENRDRHEQLRSKLLFASKTNDPGTVAADGTSLRKKRQSASCL